MQSVLLIIHLMIAVSLVGVVLLQRSEGGALGIGGGGGGGGMGGIMSGRGAASALTRTTAILAAAFFATSIALSLVGGGDDGSSLLDRIDTQSGGGAPLQLPTDILGGGTPGAGDIGDPAPALPAPTGPAVPLSQ
ncbi:Protein translocase membrane subunit SecG [hydrothermal vent metagenome]|uniref:Protein translocase membrane subunit SecG n=1 Tax=hydrothermal vent metagenome TaxID=652676 RepID=A0A3B0T0N3_9ZZZZ